MDRAVRLTWSRKLRQTRAQHRPLERALEMQRQLYNAALGERIDAWRKAPTSITRFDQTKSLTVIRADDPDGYGAQPVAMSRWTLGQIDEAKRLYLNQRPLRDASGHREPPTLGQASARAARWLSPFAYVRE